MKNPDSLFEWAENENPVFRYKWVQWGIKLISSTMVCSIFLLFISFRYFLFITGILLLIQLILFTIGFMFYFKGYGSTNLYRDTIATFQKSLTRIEKEKFESKYLSDLKSSLIDSKGNCASKQINELYLIVDMMSFENRPVLHFLLNVTLLWDYHCMISLEKWKQKSGRSLREWLTTIGRVEELSSIAAIRYDNPKWCIPQFSSSKYYFSAEEMGHPLLPLNSRVCNDLNIKASGNVLLITGSNMSG
jgi:hypothetical protein